MSRPIRAAAGVLVLLLWVHLLPSCREREASVEPPASPIRVILREPTSLDPAFLQTADDFAVAANLFEGLFRWDGTRGKVVPAMAASYKESPDGLMWTFVLSPTHRFNDGTPVTARHFETSWKRILDPATASPGADALMFLKGARAHLEDGQTPVGVSAPDATTLLIRLESPEPHLPEMLASPRLAPVLIPKGSKGDQSQTGTIRGSGPFMVERWKPGEGLLLQPNPLYQPPPRRPIQIQFMSSEANALAAFESGLTDLVIGLVPLQEVQRLLKESPKAVLAQSRRSVFYLLLNLQHPPLHQGEVRRALGRCVDRQTLVDQVLRAGQRPAMGFVPPLYPETPADLPLTCAELPDVPLAPPSGLLEPLLGKELLCNESETLKSIMEFLQHGYATHAKLDLKLGFLEWGTYYETLKQGQFDIARMSFTGGVDPLDLLENFTTGHPNNLGNYSNVPFDELVQRIRGIPSLQDRAPLLREAHQILCRDMPAIPVYYSSQVYLVRPEWRKAFKPDPDGLFRLDQLAAIPEQEATQP